MVRLKSICAHGYLRAAQRIGKCAPEDTVVVAGTPRGGTTLVLEILQHLDGYKAANEPEVLSFAAERGFTYRPYMAPGDQHSMREAYLDQVVSGQLASLQPWLFNSRRTVDCARYLAKNRKLVVKFVRCNRMLQWFEGRFPVRGLVFVIRHPCAVVASMLQHGAWDSTLGITSKGRSLDLSDLPEPIRQRFRPMIDKIETPEDALAVVWCLDNYIPLMHFERHPWVMMPYERLVRNRREELQRVTKALGMPLNERMVEAAAAPSSSTKTALGSDAEGQLAKWQRNLPEATASRVLSFVEMAGLGHLYGPDPEPNYDELDRLQDPRWQWHQAQR